jgi:hypothetical protein
MSNFYEWMQVGIDKGWISPGYCATHDGGYDYLTDEEKVEYEEGGDPFISGDLEINNEVYNNPAVMVRILINSDKMMIGYLERAPSV